MDKVLADLLKTLGYIALNAEAIIGDMDSVYIAEHGLNISFEVLPEDGLSTVKVEKELIVINK